MKIDYDAIINAGAEYLAAKANLFERYHAPIYVGNNPPRDLSDRYHEMRTCERILQAVAEVSGIQSYAIIQAARAFNRYYDKGGERIISSERLIKAFYPV